MKKIIILTLVVFGSFNYIYGQYTTDRRYIEEHMRFSLEKSFNKWDIMVGYGPCIFKTDLTTYTIFPDNNWKFAPMVTLSYQLLPAIAFDFKVMNSDMYSGDQYFWYDGNLTEYSVNARFYINQMLNNPGPLRDKWNFYVNLGYGVQAYRSRLFSHKTGKILTGDEIEGDNYEGPFVQGYDKKDINKKIGRKTELVIPIGVGTLFRINRSFDLGIETSIHYGLEDDLDNILLGAGNDTYWHTSFNLSYKIGKKDKRHSKWTYRNYGFNIFGKKKQDPLEDEINKLEKKVIQQKGILRLKIDSVITEEYYTKIYLPSSLFPIYFYNKNTTFKDYENQINMAQVAMLLKKHPTWKIKLVGHAKFNEKNPELISDERAKKVKDYMISRYGIPEKQMKTEALRDSLQVERPLITNKDKNNINIDKRVDIFILRPETDNNKKEIIDSELNSILDSDSSK